MIFALAEILGLKEFGEADDLGAAPGSICHAADGFFEVFFRLRAARHLHQSHTKFLRRHDLLFPENKYSRTAAVSYQLSAISENASRFCGASCGLSRWLLICFEGPG